MKARLGMVSTPRVREEQENTIVPKQRVRKNVAAREGLKQDHASQKQSLQKKSSGDGASPAPES